MRLVRENAIVFDTQRVKPDISGGCQICSYYVSWQNAVGRLCDERFDNNPIGISCGSVYQIYSLGSLCESRVLPSTGEVEPQSRYWLPRCLGFCALNVRVEVQIDRRPVYDL